MLPALMPMLIERPIEAALRSADPMPIDRFIEGRKLDEGGGVERGARGVSTAGAERGASGAGVARGLRGISTLGAVRGALIEGGGAERGASGAGVARGLRGISTLGAVRGVLTEGGGVERGAGSGVAPTERRGAGIGAAEGEVVIVPAGMRRDASTVGLTLTRGGLAGLGENALPPCGWSGLVFPITRPRGTGSGRLGTLVPTSMVGRFGRVGGSGAVNAGGGSTTRGYGFQ